MKRAAEEAAALKDAHSKELGAKDAQIAALQLAAVKTGAAKASACQELERTKEMQGSLAEENITMMDMEELEDSLAATKECLAKTKVSNPAVTHLCF